MGLQTISQISKAYNLSTRTLRYYEQIGLIKSEREEHYAYRLYSEDTIKRLQQIIVLRKLRIPLKQIALILQSDNATEMIDLFQHNLSEVNDEINSLVTIRDIISNFIARLNEMIKSSDSDSAEITINIIDDTTLLETADALMAIKTPPKFSMGFDIAHNDKEVQEAFKLYQKAFGAVKVSEFSPPGPNKENLHIIMDINGMEVLLHPVSYGEERVQTGGTWAYDDEIALRNAIDVLAQDAQKVRFDSWPHWPICAFITDRYGVEWILHN